MDIKGRTVLILGGSGLVGMAISRRILKLEPKELIILSLTKREVEEGVKILRSENPGQIIKRLLQKQIIRSGILQISIFNVLNVRFFCLYSFYVLYHHHFT